MGRKEILFDGYFYDVTDFIKKHPGGSIIEYYTKSGEDATHAVQQFHQRSIKRVNAIMNSLKKRPAPDSESILVVSNFDRSTTETVLYQKTFTNIGLGIGLSSTWWRRGHNRHHSMAQRLNHDVDLETMPLLAYNTKVVKDPKAGSGFMIQNQALLFVLIDTFLGTSLWKTYLHPRYVLKHKLYLEMVTMVAHHVIFYQLIGFFPALISCWVMSIYLFANFALSQSYLPVTTEPNHWVEYAFCHTADVDHRTWCNWWMGYLNYQIEHHLFPTMPQFRHPLITERVKALAEKHNLPYMVYSYPEAMQKTFKNLNDVSKELKHL